MPFVLVDELAAVGVDKTVAEEIAKNPKAAAALQERFEGHLRQSDYDRFMNTKKAEFTAQQKTLQEEKEAFELQKKNINDQYMNALQTRETTETQLAALRAKAKTASDVYGVDLVKELFGDGTQQPPAPRTQNNPPAEPTGFEKRIEQVESLVPSMVNYATELMDIARQHQELFPDKPLVFKDLLAEATTQRRSPTAVWDDKFGATAKRTEIMADKYRAEGAAKAKEELEKKYSGQQVNGMRTDLPISPVFLAAANKELSSPKDRAGRAAQSVQAATEALLSGKYRQGARAAQQ